MIFFSLRKIWCKIKIRLVYVYDIASLFCIRLKIGQISE